MTIYFATIDVLRGVWSVLKEIYTYVDFFFNYLVFYYSLASEWSEIILKNKKVNIANRNNDWHVMIKAGFIAIYN